MSKKQIFNNINNHYNHEFIKDNDKKIKEDNIKNKKDENYERFDSSIYLDKNEDNNMENINEFKIDSLNPSYTEINNLNIISNNNTIYSKNDINNFSYKNNPIYNHINNNSFGKIENKNIINNNLINIDNKIKNNNIYNENKKEEDFKIGKELKINIADNEELDENDGKENIIDDEDEDEKINRNYEYLIKFGDKKRKYQEQEIKNNKNIE